MKPARSGRQRRQRVEQGFLSSLDRSGILAFALPSWRLTTYPLLGCRWSRMKHSIFLSPISVLGLRVHSDLHAPAPCGLFRLLHQMGLVVGMNKMKAVKERGGITLRRGRASRPREGRHRSSSILLCRPTDARRVIGQDPSLTPVPAQQETASKGVDGRSHDARRTGTIAIAVAVIVRRHRQQQVCYTAPSSRRGRG